jgi:hypothetical protein
MAKPFFDALSYIRGELNVGEKVYMVENKNVRHWI